VAAAAKIELVCLVFTFLFSYRAEYARDCKQAAVVARRKQGIIQCVIRGGDDEVQPGQESLQVCKSSHELGRSATQEATRRLRAPQKGPRRPQSKK